MNTQIGRVLRDNNLMYTVLDICCPMICQMARIQPNYVRFCCFTLESLNTYNVAGVSRRHVQNFVNF